MLYKIRDKILKVSHVGQKKKRKKNNKIDEKNWNNNNNNRNIECVYLSCFMIFLIFSVSYDFVYNKYFWKQRKKLIY